jgi:Co/Zn/Cd efflux system component
MKLPWLYAVPVWLGFAHPKPDRGDADQHGHSDGQSLGGPHGHTHGVVDPTIATSERGIWAIKWSFVILVVTAALQLAVVIVSDSIALLADAIHSRDSSAVVDRLSPG